MDTTETITYVVVGPVRGWDGGEYDCAGDAVHSAKKDRKECAKRGLYSDRGVYARTPADRADGAPAVEVVGGVYGRRLVRCRFLDSDERRLEVAAELRGRPRTGTVTAAEIAGYQRAQLERAT